jgi:2-oxoglutarate dehydrogenase E2 component (dihydrolipoamide succinyltransferase)
MNQEVNIVLPKLGESIVSATIVRWFKKVGDFISLDEPILEVSTDKVNSEIPSPSAGILQEICAEVGQEVDVGQILAILQLQKPAEIQEAFLSPSVSRLLKEEGIGADETDLIPKTGEGGRLTRKDVEAYLASKSASLGAAEGVERIKMTHLRKAIADNMVKSFYAAPHASLMTEVDMTFVLEKVAREKGRFLAESNLKLTVTPYIAEAIGKALQDFPLLNASLDGDTIIMKKFVNLGIAVSIDHGVMVPVILDARNLSLRELTAQINLLAEKARTNQLKAEDVQQGTITMTNFGMTGTMIGIPIIRHPEVAIIGIGAITKKVVPLPDETIGVRSMMWVTLTFDHRVLDGLYGCEFLSKLKRILEGTPE